MHTHRTRTRVVIQSSSIEQRAKVLERNPTFHLRQYPIDHVLEVGCAEQPGSAERQQMAPRFGREATTFVRAKDPEGHGE